MYRLDSCGQWEFLGRLGSGSFGAIYHWRNNKNGEEIATKLLKARNLRPDEMVKLSERWRQEYEWQQNLDIDCIVRAVNIKDSKFLRYINREHTQHNLPVIIMEYCNGGDLRTLLEMNDHVNGLPEHEVRSIVKSLCISINYLHNICRIQHRDLKPENILIQIKDNRRFYKLADFGYVRAIPEMTMSQSVVGTAHYAAPEIIQGGSYNCSIDYWSMGIIIYEVICGIRPFLPHKKWITILKNVTKKPPKCMAITEWFQGFENKPTYRFKENICRQNFCTKSFVKRIENWLQAALDLNYKSRGHKGGELIFYKEIDDILETNIVTVFFLSSREFFSFELTNEMTFEEFKETLRNVLNVKQMHIVLPLLHPKHNVSDIKKATDLYVPEWIDTSEGSRNPLAMLYVIEIGQCDCNAKLPQFSYTMRQCMQVCSDTTDHPEWLIEEMERHVHYYLTKEQQQLQAYMQGLHCFAITLEHDIIMYGAQINALYVVVLQLRGKIKQFNDTLRIMLNFCNSEPCRRSINIAAQKYSESAYVQYEETFNTIRSQYALLRRNSAADAKWDIYESLPQQDIYRVKEYRLHLQHQRSTSKDLKQRLSFCQKLVDASLKERKNFYTNSLIKEIEDNLKKTLLLYNKTQDEVKRFEAQLIILSERLIKATALKVETWEMSTRKVPQPVNGMQMQGIGVDVKETIREAEELMVAINNTSLQFDFST